MYMYVIDSNIINSNKYLLGTLNSYTSDFIVNVISAFLNNKFIITFCSSANTYRSHTVNIDRLMCPNSGHIP